jgi:hypothetical protein
MGVATLEGWRGCRNPPYHYLSMDCGVPSTAPPGEPFSPVDKKLAVPSKILPGPDEMMIGSRPEDSQVLGAIEILGSSPLDLLRKGGRLPTRRIVLPNPSRWAARGNQFTSRRRGPRIAERIQPPRLMGSHSIVPTWATVPQYSYIFRPLGNPPLVAESRRRPLDLNATADSDGGFPPTGLSAWILAGTPLLFADRAALAAFNQQKHPPRFRPGHPNKGFNSDSAYAPFDKRHFVTATPSWN